MHSQITLLITEVAPKLGFLASARLEILVRFCVELPLKMAALIVSYSCPSLTSGGLLLVETLYRVDFSFVCSLGFRLLE